MSSLCNKLVKFVDVQRHLFKKSYLNLNIHRYNNSESAAYDGDGKTTVKQLTDDTDNLNFISSYSSKGFRLSNKLFIQGSIILFPTNVFSWTVQRGNQISLDSLLLFDIIVPKIKILVIGYGSYGEGYDSSLPIALRKKGITCELLPTPHAVTTYNYLAHDAVHVAGAFIPTLKSGEPVSKRDVAILTLDAPVTEQRHDKFVDREVYDVVRPYFDEAHKDKNKKKFD